MPCYALNRKFEVKLFFMRLPLLSVILFGGLFFSKAQEVLPTNIILIIGDGTGLTQITAGMYANGNKTNLEAFSTIGLAKTHSSNALVTDSAASGTAMASGVKTLNGVIGISMQNKKSTSILEYCKEQKYLAGLIATSSIVHATPASFYAKVNSRRKYQDIALQLSESKVDYFIGGGKKHFIKRDDKRDLLNEMQDWSFPKNLTSFDEATAERIGYFTSNDEPERILDGRRPALDEAVKSMLKKLTAKKNTPFFMMIEGSQIDWGGHANELDYVVSEFLDFDKAIGVAVKFVKENPNTLLIVTADHETGGLGITSGDIKTFKPEGGFVTLGHTAAMVPVFAMGVGANQFSGIYENTAIFDKMLKVLNKTPKQ